MGRTKRQDDSFSEHFKGVIGTNLRTARVANNMTQEEVTTVMKKAPSWISEIESGRSNVYAADVWSLAKLYSWPVEGLFTPGGTASPWRTPHSLPEWQLIFPGDEARAQMHYTVDRAVDRRD